MRNQKEEVEKPLRIESEGGNTLLIPFTPSPSSLRYAGERLDGDGVKGIRS
jgi:hypothetical protein